MFRKRLFIIGLYIVFLFIFRATAMAELEAPICVSPKKPYGSTAWWYSASRAPIFSWTPVSGATHYYIKVAQTLTPTEVVFERRVENGTTWRLSRANKLEVGAYTWWVQAWNNSDGYGPLSEGAEFLAGDLLTMSINASAFVPWNSGYNYSYCYAGGCLRPSDNFSHTYSAPLILPDGARVFSVTFHYRNDFPEGVERPSTCELKRSAYDSVQVSTIALITAATAGGYGSTSTTAINTTIDNYEYSYFIMVNLPSTSNDLIHIKIEYFN